MIEVRTAAELRRLIERERAAGARVGFVPTMGSLHEGHLSLCTVAREHADVVVMSIFVNPLQFGAGEDLERYPRDLARDAELAAARGVTLLFTPDVQEVYPGDDARVRVYAPVLGSQLCGRFRPGHFEGVLTVVAKLFNLVRPDVAVFGQKDLQQAALIRRMVHDLGFDVNVVVAPIIREPDGLALSSRNVYLSTDERKAALALNRALLAAQRAFADGETEPQRVIAAAEAILAREPGVAMQYVELVDPDTLAVPDRAERGHAVAMAGYVGSTRLIDNQLLS